MSGIQEFDVVIIGAGPIGLFGIFQAGMLGMRVCVFDPLPYIGGQCSTLYPDKPIYDIPGYPKITAQDLVNQLEMQVARFDPVYYLEQCVVKVDRDAGAFVVYGTKDVVKAKAVVIAAGVGAFDYKKLEIDNAHEFESKSLFYVVRNKESMRDKEIAIFGGGDSAVDWAIELSNIAKRIYLVHRREKFRCAVDSINQVKNLADKIEIVTPYQLHSLIGNDGMVSGVILHDMDDKEKVLDVNIVLAFFGLAPDLSIFDSWGLGINHHSIPVDISTMQTCINGIYAVGDVAQYDRKLKLILTGFSEVTTAMHHAYIRVFDHGEALFRHSTSVIKE